MAKKNRQKKQITPERLMELSFAYAPPLIISAAAANKVFDALENSAKTAEEVAKKTGASPRALRILMNALVGLDLLKKGRRGRYSLTPESAAFLISEKPGTHAGFFGTIAPQLISRWLRLTDIVREGRPAVAVNQETEGTEFFSHLVENIIPMSYPAAQKLGDHLKIAKTKNEIRVLDLAAGSGIWGIALAQKSPRVHVSAVDWAGMIPTTKRITEKFGVRDRFNFVEGDLLEASFGTDYDIAILGHILHSEGEERSRKLLKKTFPRAEIRRRHRDRRVAGERSAHRAAARAHVRRANACEHGKGRHFQLQRNQKLARRCRIQKSAQTRGTRAFTTNSGNKALIRIGFSSLREML